VALIPVYTPLRTDETDVSGGRVFYGALNVFLEQRSALFRRLPRWLTSWLDSPWLLRRVARGDSTIDPRLLGALTTSMLEGEAGHQARELDRLDVWLRNDFRPEVVVLSNSLLLGMARRLRADLGVPVICELQGEEIFLDELPDEHRRRVLELMRERAAEVDAFVAPSAFYADAMAELLQVPRRRIHHVPLGISLDGYTGARPARPADTPFTVGYMARIAPEKGLHLLAEAFILLARRQGAGPVRLRAAGWMGGGQKGYLDGVRRRLAEAGLADRFEFLGEVDRATKVRFLKEIDVLSVPAPAREPKGLFVLEALASATPVALPARGAFNELVAATGGGVLCRPDSPAELARALAGLQDDPARGRGLGERGQAAVVERYSDTAMARRTAEVYHEVIGAAAGGGRAREVV
jgi:glycosyltransferase involved in cell wall biosynthesis